MALRDAALAADIRLRRVRLRQRRWWREDHGLLLAFDPAEERALVLAPDFLQGGYQVVEAGEERPRPLDDATASRLVRQAYSVSRCCKEKVLTPPLWHRFAGQGSGEDRAVETVAALGAGVLAVIPALALLSLPSLGAGGMIAVLALAVVAGAVFEYLRRLASARRSGRTDQGLHAALWERLLALPLRPLQEAGAATISGHLHHGLSAMQDRNDHPGLVLQGLALLLPALAVLVYAAPGPALAVMVLLVIGGGGKGLLLRHADALRHRREQVLPELEETLSRSLPALPQLRLLGAVGWAAGRAQEAMKDLLSSARDERLIRAAAVAAGRVMLFAAPLAAVGLLLGEGRQVTAVGGAALAAWVAAQGAAHLAEAFGKLPLSVRLSPLQPVLEAEPEGFAAAPVPARIEELALVDVCFTYPGAAAPCLRGITLTVKRGEVVALAGPSGSGKSTLLMLALGLMPPDSGEVLLNGQRLSAWNMRACRDRMGSVLQDERVELATVRSVILGMSPLPPEQAWEAARLVRLDEDIAALPMGIQTIVGEGIFPAGMMQRLLIARALARNPDLLVLDEATAALDEEIQAALFAALRERGMAVLVASHRATTLALADHVLHLGEA